MPKVGGRRKKNRSHKQPDAQQQRLIPKTFIFKKGKCPAQLSQLTLDLRRCFYPHTAMKLEDSKKIAIKSYLKAAKYYNVNHLITLQHSNDRQYIRFIKVGGGQMTFRIMNFCSMKSIVKNGGQPFSTSFAQSLLVLNGFNDAQQVKMIGKGLQQLFPSLNLTSAKTQNLKRVISFSYRAKKKYIYFRQYKIVQGQGGVSSSFKKLMDKPKDLSNFRSLRQYLESQQSSIQGSQNQQTLNLVQMGPRLKLKFVSFKQSAGVLDEKQLQEAQNEYREQEDNRKRQKKNGRKQSGKTRGQNEQDREEQVDDQDEQIIEEENADDAQNEGEDEDEQAEEIDLQEADEDQ